MKTTQLNLNLDGHQARDAGIGQITDHYPGSVESAVLEIQRTLAGQPTVTADDVRHLVLPHPNCLGAAFRTASQRKLIQPAGYTQSKTGTCHAHVIRVWIKGTEHTTA